MNESEYLYGQPAEKLKNNWKFQLLWWGKLYFDKSKMM